jgi:hypothetical protein
VTLNSIYKSGGSPNAFVFHICGMPWAATNSPALKAHLEDGTTAARILRSAMFGTKTSPTVASDVQILTILEDDLGSQTISYNDEKSINVSNIGSGLATGAHFGWSD